ncbi:hypothetical protein RRV45_05405 [Bacillus sp. DTU_2020_1000418_1_SI_GHA_SEK_038]|uniref:hypothetical protein n=1 Tax=Bacillus sp. DTU_2020_1000418_1_SI_GHA_SEK_038 TaxID=3077585 RepID=UPI0028ECB49E|nr:hypothetical protein [Bacillus sp. DTU_2020_1000418_1_SI_GHA_SEK_038]WNS76447.1 hypothetical protein RRV45_05405 [Bacillus sp. DTU_2020_1000418_1_SI_GHA_SEK_038]
MADINKSKRADNDTSKEVETGVGAFTGDTMASALDPFGSVAVAGAVSGGALDNEAGKGTVDDDNQRD